MEVQRKPATGWPIPEKRNRFRGALTVEELLGLMVGAGSVCWENPAGAGEFDSAAAKKIVDEGFERLKELISDSTFV